MTRTEIINLYDQFVRGWDLDATAKLKTKNRLATVEKFRKAAESKEIVTDNGYVVVPFLQHDGIELVHWCAEWQIDGSEQRAHNEAIHAKRHELPHYDVISDRGGIRIKFDGVETFFGGMGDGALHVWVLNRSEDTTLSLAGRGHDYDIELAQIKAKHLTIYYHDCEESPEVVCDREFDETKKFAIQETTNGWKVIIK